MIDISKHLLFIALIGICMVSGGDFVIPRLIPLHPRYRIHLSTLMHHLLFIWQQACIC